MDILVLTETGAYVAVSDSSQASDVGSIPIARSINPDDSVALTRLSSLNWTKNRLVLDGSWTVLDSIGRSIQALYFAGLTEHILSAPAFRLSESLLFTAHECREFRIGRWLNFISARLVSACASAVLHFVSCESSRQRCREPLA